MSARRLSDPVCSEDEMIHDVLESESTRVALRGV